MGTFNCRIWIKEDDGKQARNDRIETYGERHHVAKEFPKIGKNKKIFT